MEILSDATFKGKIIAKKEVEILDGNLQITNPIGKTLVFNTTEFNYSEIALLINGLKAKCINLTGGALTVDDGSIRVSGPTSNLLTQSVTATEFVISDHGSITRENGDFGNRRMVFPATLTEFYNRGYNPYEIVVNHKLDSALKSLTEFFIQKDEDLSGSYQKKDCSTVFRDMVPIDFDIAASCTKFSVDMPWESDSNAISARNVIDMKMTKGENPISPVNIDLEARCDSTTANNWRIIATKSSSFAMSSADNYKIHILGVKPY